MKQTFFKLRTIFTGLALSVAIILVAQPASAKDKKQDSTVSISPVVEFIGSDENISLFSLTMDNATPVKFELVVSDANGAQVFIQEFEAAKFSKYFKLVNEGGGDNQDFTFTVRTLPNGIAHVFNATSSTRLQKNVTITKL